MLIPADECWYQSIGKDKVVPMYAMKACRGSGGSQVKSHGTLSCTRPSVELKPSVFYVGFP